MMKHKFCWAPCRKFPISVQRPMPLSIARHFLFPAERVRSMFVSPHWTYAHRRCVDVRRHQLEQQQERRAYYRLLRHLLTEEVQRIFKEDEHRPLTAPMSDLVRRLENASRKSRNN